MPAQCVLRQGDRTWDSPWVLESQEMEQVRMGRFWSKGLGQQVVTGLYDLQRSVESQHVVGRLHLVRASLE